MALEKTKTKSGTKKLPDGVNRPAVFNMRKALRELPTLIASAKNGKLSGPVVTERDMLDLIASSHARRADLRLKGALREKLRAFIDSYLHLLGERSEVGINLRELAERAHDANRPGRITGNGAEFIVDAILKAKKRGLSVADLQLALDLFVASQTPKAALAGRRVTAVGASSPAGQLFRELVDICQDYEEDI